MWESGDVRQKWSPLGFCRLGLIVRRLIGAGQTEGVSSRAHEGGRSREPERALGSRTWGHTVTLGSTCWLCMTQFTFPTCQTEHENVSLYLLENFWKVM